MHQSIFGGISAFVLMLRIPRGRVRVAQYHRIPWDASGMVVIKHSCFCESPRSIRNSCTVSSQTQRLIGKKVSFMTTRACITCTAQWNIYCTTINTYIESRLWETSVIRVLKDLFSCFSSFLSCAFFVGSDGSDALENHLLVALFGKYFIGKPLMHFLEKRWSFLF